MGQEWAYEPKLWLSFWLDSRLRSNRDRDQLSTQCWCRSLELQGLMNTLLFIKCRHLPEEGFFNNCSYKRVTERSSPVSKHCWLGLQKKKMLIYSYKTNSQQIFDLSADHEKGFNKCHLEFEYAHCLFLLWTFSLQIFPAKFSQHNPAQFLELQQNSLN